MNTSNTVTSSSPRTSARGVETTKQMLRFITCGSVDDGKSTLIGRMLLEAGAIYQDQIAEVSQDSARHGTTGLEVDPALLLDGLEDERKQGITIDVAYRYFSTDKRKFVIADTPGHEQFTRNMATAASTADVAVILIDASKGVLPQTRRHAFIVSLLGVQNIIVAINKMDLVGYAEATFDQLRSEFESFAAELGDLRLHFIPVSGLKGDNVVHASSEMAWYQSSSLLELLEEIEFGSDLKVVPFRLPVQYVNRPDSTFRGFCGTLLSGILQPGSPIQLFPSGKKSKIKSIVSFDGPRELAAPNQAITVTLEDEIDIVRGDVIADPDVPLQIGSHMNASIVWMSEDPLRLQKKYWLKQLGQKTSMQFRRVHFEVDVNTLDKRDATSLQLNEIGFCEIETQRPIAYDSYDFCRDTGSFIVVDRVTHQTVAAGMFKPIRDGEGHVSIQDGLLKQYFSRPAHSLVSLEDRQARYGHPAFTVLISGLVGSGKTTIAKYLEKQLFESDCKSFLLDGQTMRTGLSQDLGFSEYERSENLRRAGEIAKLLNDSGVCCILSFVAPNEADRAWVRDRIGADRYLHVHISTPMEICRQRDKSGLYEAYDQGLVAWVPGLADGYDEPVNQDAIVSTENTTPQEVVDRIMPLLRERDWLTDAN